jgi:micrococcal nuclease
LRLYKSKWTIRIGSWTLTEWFRFIVVLSVVIAAAEYITGGIGTTRNGDAYSADAVFNASDKGSQFTGEVVNVVDGDTLDVIRFHDPARIRLFGIDCPEIKQTFGPTAKVFTSDLALHRSVVVRVKGRDKYGRILADIAFADGRILNQELVKSGLAWWYQKFDKNDSQMAGFESDARARRIGLWSDPSPVAPWDFRAEHQAH